MGAGGAGGARTEVVPGAPASVPLPETAPVARPPWWLWLLGLLGVALLLSAWPFPTPS
jgi:hypothetical protein